MKTTPDDIPAIIVGGGGTVMPKKNIDGTNEVVMPENFEVCGAVGATIAEIGASAEGIADLAIEDRDEAIKRVINIAKQNLEIAMLALLQIQSLAKLFQSFCLRTLL